MAHEHESDVLVAGAGPVGLFAALELATRGVRVSLVEEEWREAARSYALALHPHSLELLGIRGLADAVLERAHRVDTVAFYEGAERRRALRLSALRSPYPFLAVLPQHDLEGLLVDALQQRGVPVHWNQRLARLTQRDDHVQAEIHTLEKVSSGYAVASTDWVVDSVRQHRARFVIGADGHRSTVRQLLGLEWAQVGQPELYAVIEFEGDAAPRNEVRVVLDGDTSSVLWPLPRNRFRWSLRLPEQEAARLYRQKTRVAVQMGRQTFAQVAQEVIDPLLRARAPWAPPVPREVDWSVVVRFEKRLAPRFGIDHVWLAGDAAHLAGPIGVRSMNVGLREAYDLAERMAAVIGGRGTTEGLAAYDRERAAEWRMLLGLEEPPAMSWPDEWLERRAAAVIDALPAAGQELEELVDQLEHT